jgi:hypothetical protein
MLGIRSTGPPLHSAQTGSRHSTHAIEGPSPASGLLSPWQVAVAQRGLIEVILRQPPLRHIRTIRSSQRPCEACIAVARAARFTGVFGERHEYGHRSGGVRRCSSQLYISVLISSHGASF